MKHHHTTNAVSYTKLWAQIPVPLAFFALLLVGSVPRTALGHELVINQPDDYIIVEPIAGETTIIVQEPEPSWVIVRTAPPPVRFEVRPPIPYAGAIWVQGYWWWSGASYVWISGHHVRPIRGYRFVAPRWVFSGGYYYHIRGHYRPYGAAVRHRPYHHYRHVGYYGHRYHHSRGYRPMTHRGHHRGHSAHHRGHGPSDRGHSAHHRGSTSHRAGHRSPGAPNTPAARHGSATVHRTAPPRGTVNRRGRTMAQRTSPVHRGRGSGSTRGASRGGGMHRRAGTARARQ